MRSLMDSPSARGSATAHPPGVNLGCSNSTYSDHLKYELKGPLPKRRKTPQRLIELLQAIVASGREAVPVSPIDQLWPDSDGDRAVATFSKHSSACANISQLRASYVSSMAP